MATDTNTTYLTQSPTPRTRSGEPVKPTLLAFHGSGSNGTIHTVQLARLTKHLRPHFNIESLEAPYPSPAGPGVLPFFEGCGPFKRWLPPQEKVSIDGMKRGEASGVMTPEVESTIKDAVAKVKSEGGKVVGLIGFSQGTRVVAGLLKGTEIRRALGKEGDVADWLDFDFALSVCPSYPPPLVPQSACSALTASSLTPEEQKALLEAKIRLPTMQIQGSQDEWAWAGRLLIDASYDVAGGNSKVLELEIGHHYPVAPEETETMRDFVLEAAKPVTWQPRGQ